MYGEIASKNQSGAIYTAGAWAGFGLEMFLPAKAGAGYLVYKALHCFSPDTLVLTANGQRPIGELRKGDFVKSMNFETGEWQLNAVQEHYQRNYQGDVVTMTVGDDEIQVTAGHPFWVVDGAGLDERECPKELRPEEDTGINVTGRWVDSNDVRPGDVVMGANGEYLVVDDVEIRYEDNFPVCNLSVAGDPNYAVGLHAILVHNWCKILEVTTNLTVKGAAKAFSMIRPHAHHLVMQGRWWHRPAIREALEGSRKILDDVGIDKLYDYDDAMKAAEAAVAKKGEDLYNLVWARNWDHSTAYAQSVFNYLDEAFEAGMKAGGLDSAKVTVRKAMKEIAEFLEKNGGPDGKKFRFGV